jgi:DNA-binding response OmpR family regulator
VNKLLTRLIVENWKAKLMSLIVAAAIWYLIKKNLDSTAEGWPALPERSFKPDLVLVDLIMPEMDGAEIAAQIESDWALHGVPIVFLTALITAEEASDGRRIYGHRIVAKPHDNAELLRIIEENLPCCV